MMPINWCTGKFNLPFEGFLAYLHRQGFIIAIDHHLRLQELLNKLGPDVKPVDLKYLLCPIFASNEKQQHQFYTAFESYFKFLFYPPTMGNGEEKSKKKEPKGTPRWQYILLSSLLLILFALAIYQLWKIQNTLPVKHGTNEKVEVMPGAGEKKSAENNKKIPEGEGGQLGKSKQAPEVDGGRPSKSKGEQPKKDKQLGIPQPGEKPVKESETKYKPTFYERFRYIIHWVGTLTPIIVFLLVELYAYHRRRLIVMRQRGKKPPFKWPIKVEAPEPALVRQEQFYQAARFLRHRLKSDIFQLDIGKTLSKTIAHAGFITPCYKSLTQPPEYLILIDLPDYRDHYAHLFDTIVKTLEKEGIFVRRYFYENDPRVCFCELDQKRVYLYELKNLYSDHRLIIFGDGENLLDPISNKMDEWTDLFKSWKQRAILTPTTPKEWSIKEVILAQEFIILPASIKGLAALVDHLEMFVEPDLKTWKNEDSQIQSIPKAIEENIDELKVYLGEDTFQWLCACAVYPELHWDLTLYLGSLPCMSENLIKEENLFHLIRLPWFRTGTIPDRLRWELIASLDIDKSRVIRSAIIDMLEKNFPPKTKVAYDKYRLHMAVPRSWIPRENRKKQNEEQKVLGNLNKQVILQDYTLMRFLESTRSSPLHFLLPKRFQKIIFRNGLPFFGLKTGIRVALAIFMVAVLFFILEPTIIKSKDISKIEPPSLIITADIQLIKDKGIPVYKNEKGFWEADFDNGIILVYIPPGPFIMGQTDKEKEWLLDQLGEHIYENFYDDEKPVHVVSLKGYWIGKNEVTLNQFQLFVESSKYVTEAEKIGGTYISIEDISGKKESINWREPGFKQDGNYPVVFISWNDALEYCKWLSEKKGLLFQLPTEAQWEKAARGNDGRRYPWGDHEPYYKGEWFANFKAHNNWEKQGADGFEFIAPVGSYPEGASIYGLLDMAGNVWEWCDDWYGKNYYYVSISENPKGSDRGTLRVLRGGSWYSNSSYLLCAFRNSAIPSDYSSSVGFRICLENE